MRPKRSRIRKLFSVHINPQPRVRAALWVAALLIACLAIPFPQFGWVLLGIWITWNIFYTAIAVIWSMFHLRTILRARNAGLSWSVWLTLLSTLLIFSTLYGRSMAWQGPAAVSTNVTTALVVVATLLICPLLFVTILGIGWIGGAIGAFSARNTGNIETAARSVVRTGFAAVCLMGLSAVLGKGHAGIYSSLFFSLPLLTVFFYRLPLTTTGAIVDSVRRLARLVEHSLQRRVTIRGHARPLDLRGITAGLFAAIVVLVMPADLIVPLKTLGLVTLIQARSAASTFAAANLETILDPQLAASRSRIVILDMDSTVRASILHVAPAPANAHQPAAAAKAQSPAPPAPTSESRVQAEIINRLKQWRTGRIVLPSPTLHESSYWPMQGQPSPDAAEIDRSRYDTRLLAATMRTAGNVVLMLPPNRSRLKGATTQDVLPEQYILEDKKEQQLIDAAHAVGLSDPSWSTTAHLPMVPTHWRTYVPVPVLLSAEQTGTDTSLKPTVPALAPPLAAGVHLPQSRLLNDVHEFDLSRIAGIHLPQMAREGVLINFVGQGPLRDFVHISYTTLLHDEPFYLDEPGETPRWTTPHEYLRARTVFLDSLSGSMHPTPIGVMPRAEIMAYGTATLLSGHSIRRVGWATAVLVTLLMGGVIGISGFRRAPIDALWRAAMPLFACAVLSVSLFIVRGVWLDPIEPLGAGMLALGFVSQFTFSKERAERERTRTLFQRFVAPQMVNDLLSRPGETLGLGGKRQTVCVLFADVRNFTGFTELNEADKVIEVINIYMGALTSALHRYGGVLDKYTGDGLMAWFPVGADAAADVTRAVTACLAMRDASLKTSERMPPGERLDIGFGMHYGDAVVGLVGCEDLQVNWTALGYTVVVSARLQTIAAGGEVVISEQVNQITQGAFFVVEGEPVKVKGLSALVRPYKVISSAHNIEHADALPSIAVVETQEQQLRIRD